MINNQIHNQKSYLALNQEIKGVDEFVTSFTFQEDQSNIFPKLMERENIHEFDLDHLSAEDNIASALLEDNIASALLDEWVSICLSTDN